MLSNCTQRPSPRQCRSLRVEKHEQVFQNPRSFHHFPVLVIMANDLNFFRAHQILQLAEISSRDFPQLIYSMRLTGSWKIYASGITCCTAQIMHMHAVFSLRLAEGTRRTLTEAHWPPVKKRK